MSSPSVDDLVTRLRSRGVRMTAPRRAVLDALVCMDAHATAETITERVRSNHPDISPSSVYRTLDLLAEHGLVAHVHLGHGPAEYHLSDHDHAHLVCSGCGAVAEIDQDVARPFADRVRRQTGFVLELGHFALTGRCPTCAAHEHVTGVER